MNFKEILELIDKVADRGIAAIEVEQAGSKVRIEGKPSLYDVPRAEAAPFSEPQSATPAAPAPAPAAPKPPELKGTEEESEAGLHIITSPIVGTFYRSANPEAAPFVDIGDRVSKGKVLCIIEAMKLMNEIESELDGVVAKIYPQNGQPIEYGEKLFAVKV